MKLCIAGNNNIAVDILSFSMTLLNKNDICVILNKNDLCRNTWQKSLGFFAKINSITILRLEDVYLFDDLTFFSVQFDTIVKPIFFKSRRLFNIHFSYLPAYKSMYTSILPILHGETKSGVTLHKIDQGIDTGDIISQTQVEIENSSSEELYVKYLIAGTTLVCSHLQNLLNGNFQTRVQPSTGSFYYNKSSLDFSKNELNPYQTAYQISLFIRALKFRAYQMPHFKNIPIYRAIISDEKSFQKPGTILHDNDEYFEICTVDYNIALYKDYFEIMVNCCKNNSFDLAKKIIPYIENIEQITKDGWNLMMIAAYHGSFEMIKLLVEYNAQTNSSNLNGTTILMFAKDAYLKNKNLDIIIFLLQNGANALAVDIYGKTIFDYTENTELVTLLTSYIHD
jgi:methionyl-tRNA formyltransferase